MRSELAAAHPQVKDVPIVTASIDDAESVKRMAGSAQVIIAVAGPYALYGTSVIDACVEQGTHYVDLTGKHAR